MVDYVVRNRDCRFVAIDGQPDSYSCLDCGRVVAGVSSKPQANCPKKKPLLCQLAPIPDTADCRCTKCGAVYANAKPEEIKARCALEGLGQPPNVRRLFNFGKAVGKHWLNVTQNWLAGDASQAYRTPEEIDHIFTTHCQPCPLFKNGVCGHSNCGCNLGTHEKFLNKLKWRSERCPDNPPRWT